MNKLGKQDALIIMNVQNDFCPGGAMAVPEGDQVIPVLNTWIAAAQQGQAVIVASRDWHPPGHISFRERGGPWPPHCVRHTRGARFHDGLRLPVDAIVIDKGDDADHDSYSSFDRTDLHARLKAAGVRRLWLGGLALDYCVLSTALDAARLGYEVHVIEAATRPVDTSHEEKQATVDLLHDAGIAVEGALRKAG